MSRRGLICTAVLVLALGGCGSSASEGVSTDTIILREYEIDPKNAIVEDGQSLTIRNEGEIAHNLVIARGGDPLSRPDKLLSTATFLGGKSKRLTVDLSPGKYLMLCTVPGHRQLGQYGTITVR